ncbi:hypothetical protein F5Y15DRAFT_383942 [Xylariaceae sp. FL0016]|nr:hypothetical protein F5Y15DRAFT_383942 [Xylariaceae sp. FL0016]
MPCDLLVCCLVALAAVSVAPMPSVWRYLQRSVDRQSDITLGGRGEYRQLYRPSSPPSEDSSGIVRMSYHDAQDSTRLGALCTSGQGMASGNMLARCAASSLARIN